MMCCEPSLGWSQLPSDELELIALTHFGWSSLPSLISAKRRAGAHCRATSWSSLPSLILIWCCALIWYCLRLDPAIGGTCSPGSGCGTCSPGSVCVLHIVCCYLENLRWFGMRVSHLSRTLDGPDLENLRWFGPRMDWVTCCLESLEWLGVRTILLTSTLLTSASTR